MKLLKDMHGKIGVDYQQEMDRRNHTGASWLWVPTRRLGKKLSECLLNSEHYTLCLWMPTPSRTAEMKRLHGSYL